MEFKTFEDPDYGVTFSYPEDWHLEILGERGKWVAINESKDTGGLIFLIDEPIDKIDWKHLLREFFFMTFGELPDNIEIIDKPSEETSLLKSTIKIKEETFSLFGVIKYFNYDIHGNLIEEKLLVGIIYNEKLRGTEREKEIAKLIITLPNTVKKEPSEFGKNVPFTEYKYMTSELLNDLRWTVKLPLNFHVKPNIYGFEANTSRVYVTIQAHHIYIDFKTFVETRIAYYLKNILGIEEYTIIKEKQEENAVFYHITTKNNHWRLLGYWTLQKLINIANNKEFKMALEKLTIYPTRIELDYLPIATRIFTSFITGTYWLYEDMGLLDISPKTENQLKPLPPTTKSTLPKPSGSIKVPKREKKSYYERWRQKLKEDMKRLYDWEENLWTETYTTIKQSDIITGIYSLEDKRGKTKRIYTANLATPTTHGFWKPKRDPLWISNTTLAMKKHMRPKLKHDWEKLSWHWDKEIERIKKETKEKKKKLDELF